MAVSHLQIPPPVAQILMASGFSRSLRRTAFLRSQGLSTHSPHGWLSRFCSMETLWESPWEQVAQKPLPDATTLGPFITFCSIMLRIWIPKREISPTVVSPASRHSCACWTATTAFCKFGSVGQSVSLSVRFPEKWRCASMRPGIIVFPEISFTSYPSGTAVIGPA